MEKDDKGIPVREENRYKHTDETQQSFNTKVTPLRILTWIVAILLVFSGVLWLGYAVGLLAAVVPGEPGIFQGWIWGMLGVVGLVIIIALLVSARSNK
jgi:uncharacterized membrane protein (DUF485 family)